jgi:hypothetical protein
MFNGPDGGVKTASVSVRTGMLFDRFRISRDDTAYLVLKLDLSTKLAANFRPIFVLLNRTTWKIQKKILGY